MITALNDLLFFFNHDHDILIVFLKLENTFSSIIITVNGFWKRFERMDLLQELFS